MSTDDFVRSGRGGAGNFQTKADEMKILQASSAAAAQPSRPDAASVSAATLTRAGRGGAGNIYSAATGLEARAREPLATAPAAQTYVRSGRGGAGNRAEDELQRRARERAREQEAATQRARLSEKVLVDVELGLRAPEKSYAGTRRPRADDVQDDRG